MLSMPSVRGIHSSLENVPCPVCLESSDIPGVALSCEVPLLHQFVRQLLAIYFSGLESEGIRGMSTSEPGLDRSCCRTRYRYILHRYIIYIVMTGPFTAM
ncbi:hypothetical protein BaRGS_00002008 [Batillaria attramentaria]|uniref:Uncharacterized protein n=1 Tax=Batillaria attramentaria TaxID=370345 RepID=A0ABD0M539_9CAEN